MNECTDQAFVAAILEKQDREEEITAEEHKRMLGLIDRKVAGMDGFKYCSPETAKSNYRSLQRQIAKRDFLALTDGVF